MYEFLNGASSGDLERFVEEHPNGTFMQSPAWTNVKANWESEAVVSRDKQGKIRGTCLVLAKKLPLCSLLYAPRGPVCDYSDRDTLRDIISGVDVIAKKHRALAFVCDPPVLPPLVRDFESGAELTLSGTSEEHTIQCRSNYMLNIEGKPLDEIRAGFKSEYRNRIAKAEKRGVWCESFSAEQVGFGKAMDDFYGLMIQTGKRDGFPIRSEEYLTRFIKSFGGNARLYMCYAEINGKKMPLSGAAAVNFAGRFSYVYGASSDSNRELYPNYLMQWEMIKSAHKSGCRVYDFGGVPFYDDESRREYGMYRFKKGFGGDVVTYVGQFTKIYRRVLSHALKIV